MLYNKDQIKEIIPHRYEMLLVDEVLESTPGEKIIAKHICDKDRWYFKGHFPEYAVMPGVLQVEALAQTCGINILGKEENKGKLGFFAKIDNCKFKHQVLPGDELTLEVEIIKESSMMVKAKGTAKVGDKISTICELSLVMAKQE